jgi:hypothetical protein
MYSFEVLGVLASRISQDTTNQGADKAAQIAGKGKPAERPSLSFKSCVVGNHGTNNEA